MIYQVLTCFSLYGLAEDAAALGVTGSDCQRKQLSALEPCEHMGHLGSGVVGTGPPIFFRVDKVVGTAFWTRVPAYCDVIVAASCHSSHTGRWADD